MSLPGTSRQFAGCINPVAIGVTLVAKPAAGQGQDLINVVPDHPGAVPPPPTVVWHDPGGLIRKHDARSQDPRRGGRCRSCAICKQWSKAIRDLLPKLEEDLKALDKALPEPPSARLSALI
jgi:hypothetical protein